MNNNNSNPLEEDNENFKEVQEVKQDVFDRLSLLKPLLINDSDENKTPVIIETDGKKKVVYFYLFNKETNEFIVLKKKVKDSNELEKILKDLFMK